MAEQPSAVGLWLRRRRRTLDLTQAELAARAGCVLTTIKKIETGARSPSPRLAARLAEALALPAAERAWLLDQLRAPSPTPPAEPPQPGAGGAPVRLPVAPGPLIGRSRDLAALRPLLTAEARLVTLAGPGGVGKTRLALELAAELRHTFADGVWFVDLAPVREPATVPLAIARALGVTPGPAPLATLAEAIGQRRMLVVLDNLEQVIAAAPALAELLAAAPGLTLLATSRAPLRLSAEHVYEVPPLELPPPSGPHALDTYGAVQLFLRRARAARGALALAPEDGPAVAEICRRLDGLPLAIELAAAWIGVLAPPALLRRLDRRLALLGAGPRDLPPRQRTLQATLDWSFRLLGPRERRLFARLGVFVGGTSLEAVERVCWASERGDLLPLLRALVDQSCLRQQPDAAGEPRFHMLETLREYALARLEAAGGAAELHERHALHFLALAEEAAPQLRATAQGRWLDLLEAEHENLRAACAWLLEAGRAVEALRLVGALHWFWDRRGYLHEGRALIRQALDAAADLAADDVTLRRARGWAQVSAAALAFDQGDWAASGTSAKAAFETLGPLDEHQGLTLALLRLAFVGAPSDPARAQSLLAAAREHAAAAGDPWYIGLAHFVSAQAALFGARDAATARALVAAAMPALRASGDLYLIAHGLATYGNVELAEGKLEAARAAFEEGLAAARALGDTRSIALLAANTADAARCQADYERAAELYGECLALYHELGNHAELPAILHNQAYVALGQGATAIARELFGESLRRHRERGNLPGVAEGLAGLAAGAMAEGDLARAGRLFGAAEAVRAVSAGPIWPAERFELERQVGALRARMPGPALAAHWREGAQLSLEQAVAEALAPATGRPSPAARAPGGLTAREYEVAALVAHGHTNRAIAETLVISERTVEHHVANILAKLDFSSRAQIAAWVVASAAPRPT